MFDNTFSFNIRFNLTAKGFENYILVLEAVYEYLKKIKEAGTQYRILKFLKDIKVMKHQSNMG